MESSSKAENIVCKYCGTARPLKCGLYKGVQRYLCRECKRKFKNDDHVFRMSVKAKVIDLALNSYYSGMKIADIKNKIKSEYNLLPSSPLLRNWIKKYTGAALNMLGSFHPEVGNIWVTTEMQLVISNRKLYLYEVIDSATKYLITYYIGERSPEIVNELISKAILDVNKIPRVVFVYMPRYKYESLNKSAEYILEHVPREKYADAHRIGISRKINMYIITRQKITRQSDTTRTFFNGVKFQYNFFTPDNELNNRTPAEAAKIQYKFHSWEELIKAVE